MFLRLVVNTFSKYSCERASLFAIRKKTSELKFSGCMVYTDTYFQALCQTELWFMWYPVGLSWQSWLRLVVRKAFWLLLFYLWIICCIMFVDVAEFKCKFLLVYLFIPSCRNGRDAWNRSGCWRDGLAVSSNRLFIHGLCPKCRFI